MRVMKWMVTMVAVLIASTAFAQRGAGGGAGAAAGAGAGGGARAGGGGMRGDGSLAGGTQSGSINRGGNRQRVPPALAALRDRVQLRSYEFKPTGEQVDYVLFVPGKYKKNKPIPLVIALHGAGVTPDSIIGSFANAADQAGYILAAPMGYNTTGWYGVRGATDAQTSEYSEQDVMNVLEMVRAEFNIDPRRIYIAGHSMGGIGAIHIAAQHPGLFAAVGAMSPGFTRASVLAPGISDFDAAPVILLAGEKDEVVPIDMVRGWVAGLKERKVPTKYHEYKGGNHVVTLQQGAPKQVFAFFKKHSRPAEAKAP